MSCDAREIHPSDTRLSFGEWRGRWLDQVHDDPEMTGDSLRVMYAVSRFLNSETRSCFPGEVTLAEKAHVSMRTVQRSIAKAQKLGHLRTSAAKGHKPRYLAPMLRDGRQQGGLEGRQEGRQTFRGPPEESMVCAPNSRDSQNSHDSVLPPHNTSCCVPPNGEPIQIAGPSDREGKDRSPSKPHIRTGKTKHSSRSAAGTRLPDDWQPSEEDVAFAKRESIADVKREVARFRDHYLAEPGKKGFSLDWSRTWKNWVRTASDFAKSRQPPKRPAMAI